MAYTVLITRRAQKQIADLPTAEAGRVRAAIAGLAHSPRPVGAIKLKGVEGYRLRVGDYRVLYTVEDPPQRVAVYRVAHRRDVYRQ